MKNKSSSLLRWFALPLLWMGHNAAVAQENIYGNAPTNDTYQIQTNNSAPLPVGPATSGAGLLGGPFMGTSSLAGGTGASAHYAPAGPGLLRSGAFDIYPHLAYTLTYGNGIQASPGVNSTTFVNTVAPGLLFKMGDHWTLDYTPSLSFYSNPAFHDTTDQAVILAGDTAYRDWTFRFAQSYINATQPLVETGTQVGQEAYATALNADWQLSEQTALQLGVNQNFRFTEALDNVHEWTTADWLNYQFQPQFGAAIGITGGYDLLSVGSDELYEQILGRIIFQPGDKLQLILMAGGEDRQFINPSAPPSLNPIFTGMAQYQIRDGTLLNLTASRQVSPALFGNQLNLATTVSGKVRQRIIGNMYFEISGGYSDQSFTTIVPGPPPAGFGDIPSHSYLTVIRSDIRTFEQFRIGTSFGTRLTGSIFVMLTQNASSQSDFSYNGHQVGLALNYSY